MQVIFLEHDWNPAVDLQAMDRAHRIGQLHTVNVYRLVCVDTIEDKILNLQRFKQYLSSQLVDDSGVDPSQIPSLTVGALDSSASHSTQTIRLDSSSSTQYGSGNLRIHQYERDFDVHEFVASFRLQQQ